MPSEKVLEAKKQLVNELIEKYKDAKCIVFSDYLGLNVEEDTQLRRLARENNVDYTVVKNKLLEFAMKELGYEGLEEVLEGPTSVATSLEEVVAPAKLCFDAKSKYNPFDVKGGIIEGKVISIEQLQEIAKLPSKEELIAKVVGGFNAPISGFVRVLNANIQGLTIALNKIAEQKEQEA